MNIFYTEVDKNLQYELNARGKTGFQNRSTKALDFMLGKIANVEVIAYQGNNSSTPPVARLGGHDVHTSRWLPSGPDGYLTNWTGSQQKINFYNESDAANDPSAIVGNAYLKDTPISDQSRRTGPFITSVDVTIGDHSMGLLNKATINMVIPNVARDLDDVEEAWFRPGRYASIEIVHPESAVVTRDDTINVFGNDIKVTGGLLSRKSLPKKERIKELYPDWNVDDFLNKIAQLNVFRFEGLITSFDFSYTSDGSVEATLSLTGTSNVYTDVSMYLTGNDKNQKESAPGTNTENFKIQPNIQTTPPVAGASTPDPIAFYSFINDRIEAIKSNFKQKFSPATSFNSFLLPFTVNDTYTTDTDRFFLEGNQIIPKVLPEQIPDAKNEYKYTGAIKNQILNVAKLDKTERSNALATPASGSTPAIPRDPASIPTPASINLPTLTADSSIDDFQVVVGILQSRNLITSDEAEKFFVDIDRALGELADEEERVARAANEKSAFLRNFNTTENIQNYNRYITLGALIHVVNTYIVTRTAALNTVAKALNPKTTVDRTAEIIHSDETNFSNYYPRLVSTDPDTMLFLPKDPAALNDMNSYGTDPATGLIYYKNVVKQINDTGASADVLQKAGWKPWPGVYEKQNDIGKIFPSRIFINVEKIKQIVDSLTNAGKNAFTVKSFIASIAQVVSRCSGNSIDLKLVSYPDDPNKLILADTRYLKSTTNETVIPYSVPMFSNHANGSIVREFEFSAKLPENAKNLSYVLNQGDDITEDQIAPYMNFMYNAKNPELINKALETYKTKHSEIIQQLESARISYGLSPGLRERKQALYKAITSYIKYPTADIRTSQQITAPIFPFEVNFTIDGINGLRYGDVLTFDALPYKYRANTVFSIIGITHAVSTEGDWTTKVNCIMRPSIE
jgi:hypothetical protein